ncbi:MAG: amidohydrolase [Bacteroidales bacterium]|nr:amidohydrolase [Bacteroidales bacterium]MDD4670849.1 amidohydrolase [Bacteroidales bacterium]
MSTILLEQVTIKGEKKDVLIKGNIIAEIGDLKNIKADRTINCNGKWLLPGFVNMHTHSSMTLMRGISEDSPLQEWLNKIWDIEEHIDGEMIYWGAKLAILEMIKSGTTCFLDMYWIIPQIYRAVEEMGIRADLTYVLLDNFDREKAARQIKECESLYERSREWNQRCRYGVAIHADYTVCEDTMRWAGSFTKDRGLVLHTHISETLKENLEDKKRYGMTPVQHFESLGLLDKNTVAAHCVWVDENDIEILGKRGVNVVHNINSNLKLASGYKFKYNELRDAGANVCLGTDGAASSNNLDMIETMKTVAMAQKAWREDPKAMPISELMEMASHNGAVALNMNAGIIREGALADLILIDTHSPFFVPDFNFEANLVFSANSSCVETVICDGNIIMEGRKVVGEDEILEKANEIAWKLSKIN